MSPQADIRNAEHLVSLHIVTRSLLFALLVKPKAKNFMGNQKFLGPNAVLWKALSHSFTHKCILAYDPVESYPVESVVLGATKDKWL